MTQHNINWKQLAAAFTSVLTLSAALPYSLGELAIIIPPKFKGEVADSTSITRCANLQTMRTNIWTDGICSTYETNRLAKRCRRVHCVMRSMQHIGPSSRTSHGLTYDGERKRVVLFGGDPGGPPFADTWSWDGALWTQVVDTGPSARHGLAMAFDSARKCIVLFGGASGSNLLADTWTWDGTEWTQVADTGPAARSRHALTYDDARERVVLFGGRTAANPLGDTWEWDGTEWTQVQDVGPSARCAHAMAFNVLPDGSGAGIVLFGGAGANGAGLNDTWLWAGTVWTQAADIGPDPRAASAMVAATTTVVLFGGVNSIDPSFPSANRIIYGDSWRWSGTAWTEVQDIGPAPRWGHGMAFRKIGAAVGRVVLVGGSSVFGPAQDASLQAGVMRDTWEAPEA